jgi:hypothetical protein
MPINNSIEVYVRSLNLAPSMQGLVSNGTPTDAATYALGVLSDRSSLALDTQAKREDFGNLAQAYSIISSSEKTSTKVSALRQLISSTLRNDAYSDLVVNDFAALGRAELARFSNLSFRYVLKCLPYDSLAAIAVTLSSPHVTASILLSQILGALCR